MRSWILVFAVLAGCAGNPAQQTDKLNAALDAQYSPVRYKYSQMGSALHIETVLAGEPGHSAANDDIRRAALDYIESHCGFDEQSLKQVRIVRHLPPVWYEVWVFDSSAQGGRGATGISVVMNYRPEIDKTDVSFHAPGNVCS